MSFAGCMGARVRGAIATPDPVVILIISLPRFSWPSALHGDCEPSP